MNRYVYFNEVCKYTDHRFYEELKYIQPKLGCYLVGTVGCKIVNRQNHVE